MGKKKKKKLKLPDCVETEVILQFLWNRSSGSHPGHFSVINIFFFFLNYFSSVSGSIVYPLFQVEFNAEQQNLFLKVHRKNSDSLAFKLSSAFLWIQ